MSNCLFQKTSIKTAKDIRKINNQVVLFVLMDIFWIRIPNVFRRQIFTKIKIVNGGIHLIQQNVMYAKKGIIKCPMVRHVSKCLRIEYLLEINS